MANKHIKKRSTTLIIREVQIKTKMRYHFPPDRTVTIKKLENKKCREGFGETGTLGCYCDKVKWYSCCGKSTGSPQN